jgi:hypothetical protein
VRDWSSGWDASRRQASAPPRQHANAAFILPEDPTGAAVLRGDDPLEWLMTGHLKGLPRLRGLWCDGAVAP